MKKALVCGAGGFIGSHLVKRLKDEGYSVRGVDLKHPEFSPTKADHFVVGDLRSPAICEKVTKYTEFDEVYQLAADMGGAGFVFTGANDADILHNNALINLNMLEITRKAGIGKIFFSSSACIYPEYNQTDPDNPKCNEESAYPAAPDSDYGFEKLFSERLYLAYHRNHKMEVRIARYHNIFGPEGTWQGGREKAPAAFCRKIAMADEVGTIEMWGSGKQTRSFLYIDDCIDATRRLMESDFMGPVNIGSEEMVTISQLAGMIAEIANKSGINLKSIPGPLGVNGRNSDNELIEEKLNWHPLYTLYAGLVPTYRWIAEQVRQEALKK